MCGVKMVRKPEKPVMKMKISDPSAMKLSWPEKKVFSMSKANEEM